MKTTRGYTLIEILIATGVFSLFLAMAYTLFFSGQKVSSRAAWLQYVVNDMRVAEHAMTKAIKASSYPSTITPNNVYDVGGGLATGTTNSANYYVHFPKGTGLISSGTLTTGDGLVLYTVSAKPERQGFPLASDNNPLVLTWSCFQMVPSPDNQALGRLVLNEKLASSSTTPPGYATSLNKKHSDAPLWRRTVLVDNVLSIRFDTGAMGHTPSQVTITLTCVHPRDPALFRTSVSSAKPNVGLSTAP